MAPLKAAAHMLVVSPSLVDNNESERDSGLLVVTEERPARKVWRGVIEDIGAHVNEDIEIGCVAHYTDFVEIEGMHVVPQNSLMAFER